MSMVDRQRIAAVSKLEALGYGFRAGDWAKAEEKGVALAAEADVLHALLVTRADELAGAPEGSGGGLELLAITEALEAYEAKRWPEGKIVGGKG